MLAAIQSYFGEVAVLLMVIGACLLAIRSLRRQHRQKGSACAGGCAGCGMKGICHSEGSQNPLLSAYRHDHRQSVAAEIGKRSRSVQPSGHFHSSPVKILI